MLSVYWFIIVFVFFLKTNSHLLDNLDEMAEDLKTEPVVDQHMKEILSNLSTSLQSSSTSKGKSSSSDPSSKAQAVLSAEERCASPKSIRKILELTILRFHLQWLYRIGIEVRCNFATW